MIYLLTIKDKRGPDFNTTKTIDAVQFTNWVRNRNEKMGFNFQTRLEQLRRYTGQDVIDWTMEEHLITKGETKVKKLILVVAIAFAVLPSNARAQGINQTSLNNQGTINQSQTIGSDAASSINNAKSIGGAATSSSGSSIALNPLLQPERHAVETGSKNDSNWKGPNLLVSIEEAAKLAEAERLHTANSNLSIAAAAKKAKEEADKAKAANPAKTQMVAVQDADGNVVYVRKERKP